MLIGLDKNIFIQKMSLLANSCALFVCFALFSE
uniref:Uncharacterized protein n=1 Tax=Anguilla anguilla TaxID=7936 RepID=A0A0E9VIV5_ANGAN